MFEEKKPSGSSDDESDVDESDIIINPFAKEKPETKPGITLLDHDESGEEDSDSSSDEEESWFNYRHWNPISLYIKHTEVMLFHDDCDPWCHYI